MFHRLGCCLVVAGAVFAVVGVRAAQPMAGRPVPNIILIVADDK